MYSFILLVLIGSRKNFYKRQLLSFYIILFIKYWFRAIKQSTSNLKSKTSNKKNIIEKVRLLIYEYNKLIIFLSGFL